MDNEYFRKIMTLIVLAVLAVLSFLLLKPILLAIIFGILLAFIFTPVYDFVLRFIKSKNLVAFLMCILLISLIVIPIWYLAPVMINQSIKFYIASQQMDFTTPFKAIFPSLFESEQFAAEVGSATHSFVTKTTNYIMNAFSSILLNLPTLFLQFLVVLFTFFYFLRDKEEIISYIQSLIPFSKEIEKKLFKSSKDLTVSILYGQVILGIIQGAIAGIGFFIFKVPNALLLSLLAALAGIFPIIGTALIWIPVAIYLFVAGNPVSALGVVIFGLLSSLVENFYKPIFISRRTKLNSSIILIGMIGGLFLFGILGIILGPLILAYLLIILEIYRNKKLPDVFIQQPEKE